MSPRDPGEPARALPPEIPAALPTLAYAHVGEIEVDPDSLEHPDWCSRPRCTAHYRNGDHWSVPWQVGPVGRTGFPLIELALWTDAYQPPRESPAWVEMRLVHASLGRTLAVSAYEMEPEQMRHFAAVLIEVADRADAISEQAQRVAEAAEGGDPCDR